MTISQTKERLRVLHVISGDLWAGAEAQAYTLLKHLNKDCDVFAVLMNHGELEQRLQNCNIPVVVLDETKLSSWQLFLMVRQEIKRIQPNVIHTHRQKENILGALANITTLKVRCVRTVHGAQEFSGNWKTRLQQKLDQWVGSHFQDVIIAVSDELQDKLSDLFPCEKLKVVYNGVDVEELQSAATIADFKIAEPNKKHIGIIGRLTQVKRVDIFLETVALFKDDSTRNYHFHVIGDGPLKAKLIALAKSLDISDLVTFHGHRSDIPSCIHSLNTVVMCSDHEGMPMTALETVALGTTLIATKNLKFAKSLIKNNSGSIPDHTSSSIFKTIVQINNHQTAQIEKFTAQQCASSTFKLYTL